MAGAQCCENPPALISSCYASGSVLELGGLKAYVTGPYTSKIAIILISDVFGYEAPNLRALADKVGAAGGFYVVVPDFFYGDPYSPDNSEKPLQIWIQSHGTDKGFEDAKPVIAALKDKGISTIGAAGLCWGAKVVVELAKSDLIKAAVLLHPSLVTVDDIKEVKAPIAILGAETDSISPPELLKQFEEVISSKAELKGYVKIFPGVAHGWTVRYNTEDEKAVLSAEEAHKNTIDWFIEYVK
ncbi:carboxymethylenebutenolidase [Sarracenia purpurea var. burkii]